MNLLKPFDRPIKSPGWLEVASVAFHKQKHFNGITDSDLIQLVFQHLKRLTNRFYK